METKFTKQFTWRLFCLFSSPRLADADSDFSALLRKTLCKTPQQKKVLFSHPTPDAWTARMASVCTVDAAGWLWAKATETMLFIRDLTHYGPKNAGTLAKSRVDCHQLN